ncbi:pyruvate, water dikinase regulatory protein [Macrococcus equipercicus]|uniref:pyruvate, water dikinase regulatory protein n=1 Tax=Macrococcus equipercicus TaxID=69967 RepID=UPI001FE7869D|nr:pyruvate, water dikinase regulatory protein [Macrococcus equipercicus]
MNDHELTIFVVSDSIGETAQRMIHATLTQFPMLDSVVIKKFPFMKDKEQFQNILELAKSSNAILVTTLVDQELNQLGLKFAADYGIPYVDYLSGLIHIIQQQTNVEPLLESGALRRLDSTYFKRIEAMEYSVKYDDGKNFNDLSEADAVIVGVSRTSKTPLSMYLANKGYKIANIPLVPEVPLPEALFKQHLKVFGLTAGPNYIMNIRTERVKILGLQGPADYNNLQRIKEELIYAEEVFERLNAIVINTEYKSIEESAFYIEKYLNRS